VVVQEDIQELVKQGKVLLTGINVRLSYLLLTPDVHAPEEQKLNEE
jgi:hypothetical protein